MAAAINLVGIGSGWVVPGVFIELDFAQGPVSGSGTQRTCLLIASKTSAGTATVDTVVYGPDTPVQCQTEADAINLFGHGSKGHRGFLRWTGINKTTSLYIIACASSAGAAATLTETIATTATSTGNHRTYFEDQFVDTPINTGDTPTVIAANVVASVNSQTRWGIVASPAAGVITYTASENGPEGNWVRLQAQITPGTATIGTTTSLTANTFMSGGTTAEVNTNALATIAANRYYYICSMQTDATNLGRAATQINSQALPTGTGKQRLISGSIDTSANVITLATGLNNARAEIVWDQALDVAPGEVAAHMAAVYMLLEQGAAIGVNRKNFSGFPVNQTDAASWQLVAGRAGVAGAPSQLTLTSLLNNGVTPISITASGAAFLVKRVTTRSLSGAVADYRIRDAHKVSVCDYWCDDQAALIALEFGGKDLLPNTVQGQPPPPAQATTPNLVGNEMKRLTSDYGNGGQWSYPPGLTVAPGQTPADVINANAIIQAETNPPTRISALFPLSPVNILDVVGVLALQVG
jgi:phage tail sheath gpL-like